MMLLKNIKSYLWNDEKIKAPASMKKILRADKIVIMDIGAAGGADIRWAALGDLTRFVFFEPDERSQDIHFAGENIIVPKALGSEKARKPLHLARFPDASSLYELNTEALNDFANHDCHEIVGETTLEVDTLDSCLESQTNLLVDFMKVDAEGADLDILKGATRTLDKGVLGLRIEISFMERHKEAPLFGDVDVFMRGRGYMLFDLHREHWIRRNRVYSLNSRPQLVWGDAIYFMSRKTFLTHLKSLGDAAAQALRLTKFAMLLVQFGVHDYATEIVVAAYEEALVSDDLRRELQAMIYRSLKVSVVAIGRGVVLFLLSAMILLVVYPIKTLRFRVRDFMKRRLALLSQYLANLANKAGPHGSCVSDMQ